MKPLATLFPNATDPTSLYRGVGPFGNLMEMIPDLRLSISDKYDWAMLSLCCGLFMQRPFNGQHVTITKLADLSRKPLWIDYDDDLTDVTSDNPTHRIYGSNQTKKTVLECLMMADVVSVSTDFLGKQLRKSLIDCNVKQMPEFFVIPNAYDNNLFINRPRDKKRHKLIVWRGSETHIKDVMQVVPEIAELSKKHPEYTWLFIGMNPWFLEGHMEKGKLLHRGSIDPMEYMRLIADLEPDIMFAPLWDSNFNRAKSNIAWMEASHSGAVIVAPDFDEWKKPGITTYNDSKSFYVAMEFLMTAEDSVKERLWAESWKYIQDNLLLSKVNQKRLQIFQTFFRI